MNVPRFDVAIISAQIKIFDMSSTIYSSRALSTVASGFVGFYFRRKLRSIVSFCAQHPEVCFSTVN